MLPPPTYRDRNRISLTQVERHMTTTANTIPSSMTQARSKYSYSLKRWNPFEAWQEHVRKSAWTVGNAFAGRQDRDLRRAVVTG